MDGLSEWRVRAAAREPDPGPFLWEHGGFGADLHDAI